MWGPVWMLLILAACSAARKVIHVSDQDELLNALSSNVTIVLSNDIELTKMSNTHYNSKTGIDIIDIVNLKIEGQGFAIDGLDSGRCIYFENSEVTMKDVTFQNGNADTTQKGYGGALYIKDGIVYLTNGRILNNTASYGGGLEIDGGSLICAGCQFSHNEENDVKIKNDASSFLASPCPPLTYETVNDGTVDVSGGESGVTYNSYTCIPLPTEQPSPAPTTLPPTQDPTAVPMPAPTMSKPSLIPTGTGANDDHEGDDVNDNGDDDAADENDDDDDAQQWLEHGDSVMIFWGCAFAILLLLASVLQACNEGFAEYVRWDWDCYATLLSGGYGAIVQTNFAAVALAESTPSSSSSWDDDLGFSPKSTVGNLIIVVLAGSWLANSIASSVIACRAGSVRKKFNGSKKNRFAISYPIFSLLVLICCPVDPALIGLILFSHSLPLTDATGDEDCTEVRSARRIPHKRTYCVLSCLKFMEVAAMASLQLFVLLHSKNVIGNNHHDDDEDDDDVKRRESRCAEAAIIGLTGCFLALLLLCVENVPALRWPCRRDHNTSRFSWLEESWYSANPWDDSQHRRGSSNMMLKDDRSLPWTMASGRVSTGEKLLNSQQDD